jgi:hypothetical protein
MALTGCGPSNRVTGSSGLRVIGKEDDTPPVMPFRAYDLAVFLDATKMATSAFASARKSSRWVL